MATSFLCFVGVYDKKDILTFSFPLLFFFFPLQWEGHIVPKVDTHCFNLLKEKNNLKKTQTKNKCSNGKF